MEHADQYKVTACSHKVMACSHKVTAYSIAHVIQQAQNITYQSGGDKENKGHVSLAYEQQDRKVF